VQAGCGGVRTGRALVAAQKSDIGQVDILINNAGYRDKLILRMTEEDWVAVLDTNLKKRVSLGCKAVAPLMVSAEGGVIVNVGSVIGKVGGAGAGRTTAPQRRGLVGSDQIPERMGSAVCVSMPLHRVYRDRNDRCAEAGISRSRLKQIPLGCFGKREDVARVIAFLCSQTPPIFKGKSCVMCLLCEQGAGLGHSRPQRVARSAS